MLRRFFPRDPSNPAPALVLQPRAAPAGRLRVWVAAFGAAPPAGLEWRLDGRTVQPTPLHGGGGGLRPAHRHGARTFTGVFELAGEDGVAPGVVHEIAVREPGRQADRLRLETLPSAIPAGPGGELRVMLVSCFHRAEDRGGLAGQVVAAMPEARRPHLSLLMGDQVYLDLPTIADFPDDEAELARRFEVDYRENWALSEGYSRVLAAAPSACCPDDHEYWNNFPHASPVIQNSWRADGRARWKAAADQLFSAFQLAHPAALGEPVTIDVPPLSVLVLDQRSQRRDDTTATLAPGVLGRVDAWVDRLLAEGGYGAVVTGQSLLDEPVGSFDGKVADRMLANYGDYPHLMRRLARLADAGRPVLLLTGDVHWGRVTEIRQRDRVRFYEVICSPSSLVSTVGADQLQRIGSGLGRLLGRTPDPWPRHSESDDPPAELARNVLGPGYRTRVLHRQRGNQVAMLALRRRGGGLEMTVTYHPLAAPSAPSRVGPLSLPPR
jgi:hypothetical protein